MQIPGQTVNAVCPGSGKTIFRKEATYETDFQAAHVFLV